MPSSSSATENCPGITTVYRLPLESVVFLLFRATKAYSCPPPPPTQEKKDIFAKTSSYDDDDVRDRLHQPHLEVSRLFVLHSHLASPTLVR